MFTRLRADECATALQTKRSVGPGEYRISADNAENCKQCFSFDGPRNGKAEVSTTKDSCSLDWGNMAQVESDLRNLSIPLQECNDNVLSNYRKNKTINKNRCNTFLNAEDTRFTFPVQSFRGMSLTSYQMQPYLSSNPQCHVQDDRLGSNSRLKAKDSWVMPAPVFFDSGEAFPEDMRENTQFVRAPSNVVPANMLKHNNSMPISELQQQQAVKQCV